MECEKCGQSLNHAVLTLPWEDGDNPTAYVTCPYCGHKNTVYGYGEDDDQLVTKGAENQHPYFFITLF